MTLSDKGHAPEREQLIKNILSATMELSNEEKILIFSKYMLKYGICKEGNMLCQM